jgi:hypothetical protein
MRGLIKNKTSTIFEGTTALVCSSTRPSSTTSTTSSTTSSANPRPGSTQLSRSSSGPFFDNSGSSTSSASQRFNGASTPGHRHQQYLITRRHRLLTATGLGTPQGRLQDLNIVRQRATPVPRNDSTTHQRCLPSAAGPNLNSVSASQRVYQQTAAVPQGNSSSTPTCVSAPHNGVSARF